MVYNPLFPSNDEAFKNTTQTMLSGLSQYKVQLDVEDTLITSIMQDSMTFSTKLGEHSDAQTAAKIATQEKNMARKTVEDRLRPVIKRVLTSPNMTDAIRAALGLRIPDAQPSTPEEPVIKEAPVLLVSSRPGEVIFHFGSNPTSQKFNTKPLWATGCNIYRLEGEEWRLVSFSRKSPLVCQIDGSPALATYMARYVGKDANDLGPASQMATIAVSGVVAA